MKSARIPVSQTPEFDPIQRMNTTTENNILVGFDQPLDYSTLARGSTEGSYVLVCTYQSFNFRGGDEQEEGGQSGGLRQYRAPRVPAMDRTYE